MIIRSGNFFSIGTFFFSVEGQHKKRSAEEKKRRNKKKEATATAKKQTTFYKKYSRGGKNAHAITQAEWRWEVNLTTSLRRPRTKHTTHGIELARTPLSLPIPTPPPTPTPPPAYDGVNTQTIDRMNRFVPPKFTSAPSHPRAHPPAHPPTPM